LGFKSSFNSLHQIAEGYKDGDKYRGFDRDLNKAAECFLINVKMGYPRSIEAWKSILADKKLRSELMLEKFRVEMKGLLERIDIEKAEKGEGGCVDLSPEVAIHKTIAIARVPALSKLSLPSKANYWDNSRAAQVLQKYLYMDVLPKDDDKKIDVKSVTSLLGMACDLGFSLSDDMQGIE